jgi:hypothetical protein
MKHVSSISRESLPAEAAFIVRIESKSDCQTSPNVDSVSACKDAVKSVGVYEVLV